MPTRIRGAKLPCAMLQLRIDLKDVKPPVWRRVLVPETITLTKLHMVIQAAFGWGHAHLHEFIDREGQRYGSSDPDYDQPGEIASERTRLTTALRGGRTLKYIYDFGDQWEHQIKLEKAWAPDSQIRLPWCIDGAGATPPEDCGGSPGYEDFLQVMADPQHPEHSNMTGWLGRGTWDPTAFDLGDVNEWLAELRV